MSKITASVVLALAAFLLSPPAADAAPYDQPGEWASASHGLPVSRWTVTRPTRGAHATSVLSASRFPDRFLAFAKCVLARESGGSLSRPESGSGARNPRSSAQGRWQFLDRQWRESLSGQVAARLRDHGMPSVVASEVRRWLREHQIASWPGEFQDAGFIEVMSRGGSYHWALRGSRCEKYR